MAGADGIVTALDVWLGLMALSLSLGLQYHGFLLPEVSVDYEKLYRNSILQERHKRKGVAGIFPFLSLMVFTVCEREGK